ncbi:MAG: methyltransferase domain-containing protein [Alphaproteobacteria bacterium]|nr:methyltransferase domain-containing protein [Alphaproteobacteria bacterium]
MKSFQSFLQAKSLLDSGLADEALPLMRQLNGVVPRPVLAGLWVRHAVLCFGNEGAGSAVLSLEKALDLQPKSNDIRSYFAHALLRAEPEAMTDGQRRWIERFVQEPWTVKGSVLSRLWTRSILTDPAFAVVRRGTGFRGYDEFRVWFEALSPQEIEVLSNPFYLSGLARLLLVDDGLERFHRHLRRWMLEKYTAGDSLLPGPYGEFLKALGAQCLINEYVFFEEEDETSRVSTLSKAAEKGDRIDPLSVMLYACYRPLFGHEVLRRLLAPSLFPSALRNAVWPLARQVDDYLTEQKLRHDLEATFSPANEVSENVRAQYETNPYPRWLYTGVHEMDSDDERLVAATLGRRLKSILVAGSATGGVPIRLAMKYPKARVTGVDRSLSSLSYAKRKAREYRLKNLVLRQQDILRLGESGESFDVIETVGVLHHMQDPLEGWARLRDVLSEGGLMKVGLYSERARRHITACRNMLAAQGIAGQSADDIRRARMLVAELPEGHEVWSIMKFDDFYTTSMFRDMVFHVQEKRLTLLLIRDMLDELGLEFLGFVGLPRKVTDDYTQTYPDDTAMTDLSNWDRFEERNPDVFIGMYVFWCRRP